MLAIDSEVQKNDLEIILASRIQKNLLDPPLLQYKIALKGYTELTWEPAAILKHARRLVNKFQKNNPEMPCDVRS